MPQPTSVHFGAGNIGRGFLGQLYFESGFRTIFIDANEELIELLNKHGSYSLHIVDAEPRALTIENFEALHSEDEDRVIAAIADATIVSTAVGAEVLSEIAPVLAKGIEKRLGRSPIPTLNVLLCENHRDPANFLGTEVRQVLSPDLYPPFHECVAFVNASVGRMARDATDEELKTDPLALSVEAYCELPVDASALKQPIPPIHRLIPEPLFQAVLDMKRYIHNAGHAATAYLGHLQGHTYIWQAIQNPSIRVQVDAAMEEASKAVSTKHGIDIQRIREHWDGLKKRFENRALGDTIRRVARDPIRKLGSKERLIGTARLCLSHDIAPTHLALAAAAAILYDPSDDPQAVRLQTMLEEGGLDAVLGDVCGLLKASSLRSMIRESLEVLSANRRKT